MKGLDIVKITEQLVAYGNCCLNKEGNIININDIEIDGDAIQLRREIGMNLPLEYYPHGCLAIEDKNKKYKKESLSAIAKRFNGYKYFSFNMARNNNTGEFSKCDIYAHKQMPEEYTNKFRIGYKSKDSVFVGNTKSKEPKLFTRKELIK